MFRELRNRGFPAFKPRVEQLMRESDIRARHKRSYKVTTDSKHNLPIVQNLLDRNFSTLRAESGLDDRHNQFMDERRLAVPGDRDRPI